MVIKDHVAIHIIFIFMPAKVHTCFLKITFVCKFGSYAYACVSNPKAINYIEPVYQGE